MANDPSLYRLVTGLRRGERGERDGRKGEGDLRTEGKVVLAAGSKKGEEGVLILVKEVEDAG